ncbi:hypothetical protein H4Q26_001429 [Puccinia striiformis f. sp. tritici PST-130]|nr:hypothetical protein H4Q26_001429 [Puccinia striiformis f. sp. tritici PST-130]
MARTNYGQDISVMHGLGAMVSLAGTDGTSIRGGNRQIFQQFANHSNAQVHFNHQITAITEKKPVRVPHQPFVQLHVTFIVTNATAPSGELFNRPVDQFMARSIYSYDEKRYCKGKRPIFNSLNYLRNLGLNRRYSVFGSSIINNTLPNYSDLWKFIMDQTHQWTHIDSNALANPTTYAPTKLDKLYTANVNGFESLISTMETQTVASWNIAMCLSQQFWNYVPQKVGLLNK